MLEARRKDPPALQTNTDLGRDALGTYHLHPKYVLRIAGEACEFLERLPPSAASRVCDELDAALASAAPHATKLIGDLGAFLPEIADRVVANAVLALRRDLFNLRAPNPETISVVAQANLPPALAARVLTVAAMLRHAAETSALIGAHYQRDVAEMRALLPALFLHSNVNAGLQSSNPALWRKLQRLYVARDESIRIKERLSLDSTFFSYYLRTALKTSPHASFGPYAVGSWRSSAPAAEPLALKGLQMVRLISIRHILIVDIIRPLLRDCQNLRAFFFTLNDTLLLTEGKVTLRRLAHPTDRSAYVRNNKAEIVTLGATRAVKAVIALFRDRPTQSLSFGDVEQSVVDALPAHLHHALPTIMQAMLTADFIAPDTGYDEFADPFTWADRILSKMPGPSPAIVRASLAKAEAALTVYRTAPIAERAETISRLRARLDEAQSASGAALQAAALDRIVNEDCRLTEAGSGLNAALLEEIAPDLRCLISLMPIMERVARLQYWITEKFIGEFGASGVCDHPEKFFVNIAQHLDRLFNDAPNQIGGYQALSDEIENTSMVRALDDLHVRLMSHIEEMVSAGGPVARLNRKVLMTLCQAAPAPVRNCAVSQCVFGQFLSPAHQGARFVINHLYSGNGKMISRFLDPDDPDLPLVRSYLEQNCRGGMLAEIPGLFGFNANIHPRMFDAEIIVPPFAQRRRGARQFKLSELKLRVHAPSMRLQLMAPNGQALETFFLGAMAAPALPPVIRMLDGLYSYGGPAFDLPLMLARRRAAPDSMIDIPRIQLGEVILSRRSLFVPREALPQSDLGDEEFFVAMQSWRRNLALPRMMFAKFPPSWFQPHVETTSENRSPGKWKPLPIDFASPLAIRIFRKALLGCSVGAVFTEAAPNINDHDLWINGQRHASELKFEITRRPLNGA